MALPAGFSEIFLDEVDSTNEEAWRRVAAGAGHGTVIRAGAQTAGRGRMGRGWVSPEGNLYMSIIVVPPPPRLAAQLAFVAALGVGDALTSLLPDAVSLRFKWPNDVQLVGRKAAGILVEGRGGPVHVVGIGVNVATAPNLADAPATSLTAQGARDAAPGPLAGDICTHFAGWFERWRADGFGPLREAWLARAVGLGKPVEARLPTGTLTGIFRDLDTDGALLLEEPGGATRRIEAGDVFLTSAGRG